MRLSMALVSNYLAKQALVQPLGCWVPSDVAVPNTEHIHKHAKNTKIYKAMAYQNKEAQVLLDKKSPMPAVKLLLRS